MIIADLEEIITYAVFRVGCDPDQLRRFIQAGYIPQAKQMTLHAAARAADEDDGPERIGYGGTRGQAKSHAILAQVGMDDCQRFPGLKVLYLRNIGRAAAEQFEDLITKLFSLVPHVYKSSRGLLNFPNGSRIILGGFKDESEIDSYLGIEYDLIVIEDATTLSESKYNAICGSLRTSKEGWRPRLYASANPGGIGHCVPYGEVLTPNGWKDIKSFSVGDPVYTVTSSGELGISKVKQVHAHFYQGDLVSTNTRGLKMVCTPNHRVAKVGGQRTDRGEKFSLVPFEDLPGQATILRSVSWQGESIDGFSMPPSPLKSRNMGQPKSMTGLQYAEFMGWFLSEGFVVRMGATKTYCFGISQEKSENRAKIQKLLDAIGLKQNWNSRQVTMYDVDWWDYLYQFGKSHQKYIPDIIKNASPPYLRVFFDAMIDGDGCWVKHCHSGHYYTHCKRLADDMSEVALKLGYIVLVTSRSRPSREYPEYRVSFKVTKSGGTEILTNQHVYNVTSETKRKSKLERNHYEGMVYCIGVPYTHTFVIRQNGSVWVSGNSWFKKVFVDPWLKKQETLTRFIHTVMGDNVFIDEGYARYLNSLTGWLRRAWRDGDFSIAAGQFFTAFDPLIHVIKPFDFPPDWTFWLSLDYGFVHWNMIYLLAQDGDGNRYAIDELAHRRTLVPEVVKGIEAMLARNKLTISHLSALLAGPDIFAQRGTTKTIAEEYAGLGFRWKPAQTDRINRAAKVMSYLGSTEQNIPTRLFIFNRCHKLIECLPSMQHDPRRGEDVLKVDCNSETGGGGDDAYDSFSMAMMYGGKTGWARGSA